MENITFSGNPVKLSGETLSVGTAMPEFTLSANDLSDVTLASTSGVRAFLSVPSLDTPICDLEAREFNKAASSLPGVSIYAVSMDLPFAQQRWCAASGCEAVKTLSDYKSRSFGEATGTYMPELGLLCRAVFVLDSNGVVVYKEYVPEVRTHPDYEAALSAIKNALGQ